MPTRTKQLLTLPLSLTTLLLLVSWLAFPERSTAADPLPKPEDPSCMGYEADTVWVRWKDVAEDEDEYRVERLIGNGDWEEVATLTPNDKGSYSPYYQETDVDDPPAQRYRVRAYRSSDDSYSPYSDVCNGAQVYETENFRIFYHVDGVDECPSIDGNDSCLQDDVDSSGTNVYVKLTADALEGSQGALTRLGFERDASDHDSLDKMPIFITWCDGGGCAVGGGDRLGLSPWLMQKPFDLNTRAGDPIAWLVSLHELFHAQQYQYGQMRDPARKWVFEGQARSIQDKVCLGADRDNCNHFDDIATGAADYVGQVNRYLGNPAVTINRASYNAALFWTYLTEKFGAEPDDPVEGGMNLMVGFWEESVANPGRDGVSILNSTLANLGHGERFRDVWKDFAVASYAKDYDGPQKYQYEDMQQSGGLYDPVKLTVDRSLAIDDQVVRIGEHLPAWAAAYYEVRPDGDVPTIDLQVTQDSHTAVYYTLLAVDGGEIVLEENVEARHFDYTLVNQDYDQVVLMVATLEYLANYRVSINGNQPQLRILSPAPGAPARVGDPAAPDKFRVVAELLGPDGLPLDGADRDNYSFRVGGEEVPAESILTSADVMGQQWFVLRAPAQSSGGSYDLQVSYGNVLSDTVSNGVVYTPRDDADNMIVIDRSGSMGDDEKLEAAQASARLYVDSWREGDQLGVVAFNDNAVVEMGLTPWSTSPGDGSRGQAMDAIDDLTASGGTAIGDALQAGWDELEDNGEDDHDWAIVLLSDGLETAGESAFQDVVDDISGEKALVHAVAVGPDADQAGMQRAAVKTGGNYHYVSVPATTSAAAPDPQAPASSHDLYFDLASTYRMIATKVTGQQQFFRYQDEAGQNFVEEVIIPVESGASELIVSLNWINDNGFMANRTLSNPNGQAVTPFQSHYDSDRGVGHLVWRVSNPQGGDWTLQMDGFVGGDVIYYVPAHFVQASLRSEVTMDVFLSTPLGQPIAGLPVTFLVGLTDNGPITGASVEATIEPQSIFGSTTTLTLYDDGQHGDGAAGDGLYGATFHDTQVRAPHLVTVVADGESSLSGPFHREETFSFNPVFNDRDGDGLPDEWEEYYGTDPDVNDANADRDFDGLPNLNEYNSGSDPFNPDTDGGGAGDGSDPDPLDPSNDDVKPIWAVAHPSIEQVFVDYSLPQEFARIDLYRSDAPDGDFSHLEGGFGDFITGVYTDTNVVNDQRYCYIVVARGNNFHETQTEATCATPKADPWPPHGLVSIDDPDADGRAPSVNVTLTLWASDAVDPEHVAEGEVLPPEDSASGVTEMRISNRADMVGASWESYATTKAWTLDDTSELATVYAQFRDAAGNESDMATATIYVGHDGQGPGARIYLPAIVTE